MITVDPVLVNDGLYNQMQYEFLVGDQIFVVKIISPLYFFKCFEEVSRGVVTESSQDILAPRIAPGGTVSLPAALFAWMTGITQTSEM